MAKKTKTTANAQAVQRGYNTNLASEFYVLSMLYRPGLDANLTLGNKKSVDIAVVLRTRPSHNDRRQGCCRQDGLADGRVRRFAQAEPLCRLGRVRRQVRRRQPSPSLLGCPARRTTALRENSQGKQPNAVSITQRGPRSFQGPRRGLGTFCRDTGLTAVPKASASRSDAMGTGRLDR